jgi:hypothetical protein
MHKIDNKEYKKEDAGEVKIILECVVLELLKTNLISNF